MTQAQVNEIIRKLEHMDRRLGRIEAELAETRGALRLARFVIALLGISGLSGLAAWLAQNRGG
jgi:hypothetical protein